jgi:8-oxo-dGTP diphosphatase
MRTNVCSSVAEISRVCRCGERLVQVVEPPANPEFDVIINDYYLVRPKPFEPRGTLSQAELAQEFLELRWWPIDEITAYVGNATFAPCFLAPLLKDLLRTFSNGVPVELLEIGL